MKKMAVRSLKAVGLIVVLLAAWIGLNSFDAPPYDDSALLSQLREVPPEKNGYTVVAYLGEDDFDLVTADQRRALLDNAQGKQWDQDFVDALLQEKQQVFDDVRKSNRYSFFKLPSVGDSMDFSPYIYEAGNIWYLHWLKSRNAFRHQHYDQAIFVLVEGIRHIQRLRSMSAPNLFTYTVGAAFHGQALTWVHEMVSAQVLNAGQHRYLLGALNKIKPYREDGFGRVVVGEYLFAKRYIQEFSTEPLARRIEKVSERAEALAFYLEATGAVDQAALYTYQFLAAIFQPYALHPNKTFAATEPYYLRVKEQSDRYCSDVSLSEREGYHWWEAVMPNALGRYWITTVPDFSTYFYRRCFSHTYRDAIKTVVAMEQYKQAEGSYPATLQALVPVYLERLPRDYFSGEPLRYSPENGWLYSVGVNGRDDGGSEAGMFQGRCKKDEACYTNPTIPIAFDRGAASSDDDC